MEPSVILLLSAMPEEIDALRAGLRLESLEHGAGREFARGFIGQHEVLLAFSRWGKVAAAATTAHALSRFPIQEIVFTGIAGALSDALQIGDLVLADRLFQHDLDASPFYAPTEVPLLGLTALPACAALSGRLESAYQRFGAERRRSGLEAPRLHRGAIATGDQVIGDEASRSRVHRATPEALCVEMEGAAVAQVCHEFGLPYACLRMISDHADERLTPEQVFALARVSGETMLAILRHLER
jgi:adenosylhomocysteine nucleosidase